MDDDSKQDPKMVNISDIKNADFSDDTEPKDDRLMELLKLAYTKKIYCRTVIVTIDKVVPFSAYEPKISEDYIKYFKEKLDIGTKEEKPDPDFEKDRAHYCLHDKEFRDHLFAIRKGFEDKAQLGKEMKEKQDNKHIYDAVKEMKKPKIAELIPLLSEPLEKAGYIEFHLDKPEMGRDVYVGFSCLDSKSDREDYDSRKTLKKLVDSALSDTNWRLMSDGISYRLGYLNGLIRAYEAEDDLKNLVMKSKKLKPKQTSSRATDKGEGRTLKAPDGTEIIL